MPQNQANTIYPCHFSKGYGLAVDQAWSLLKVFFAYRFIVSSLLIILSLDPFLKPLLMIHNDYLYTVASNGYWVFVVLSGVLIYWKPITYTPQAQTAVFIDIAFITIIMHAAGGVVSGIGILLAGSIAAGGLLIGGVCALLFAALASLSILAEQVYTFQNHVFTNTSFTYAGMLGAAFFATAYLSYILAKRTEQFALLDTQQKQTISDLEELNQYIIQHLQSGIIISNSDHQIKICNESALNFSYKKNKLKSPSSLSDISSQLEEYFQLWLENSSQNFVLITLPNKNEIHAKFSLLKTAQETFYMTILENVSLYNQRLQQSKLASLGRLTASISHEIRNPLGAISHAGQLLSEAEGLSEQDSRLVEIIQTHCLRVNKIIEDVLQLSRRHPSKREKIELAAWVKNYLKEFVQAINCPSDSFFINLHSTDLWVYMDVGHLKQIMDNLCSNALKYGNTATHRITIDISLNKQQPCLRIFDNGDKIDAKTVEQIFEPFFTTSASGTGLGLYISKELAELNQAVLNYVPCASKHCFQLCLPNANSPKIEI